MNRFYRGRYKLQEPTVVISHRPWLFPFVFECWLSHTPRDPSPPAAPSSPVMPAWRGPRTAHRVAGPRPQGFESGRCNFSTHLPKAQRFIKPRSCELSTGSCGPCLAPVCVNKVLLEHSQGHSFTRLPKPLLRRNGGAGPDGQAPLVPHGKFAGSGPDNVTPGVHAAAARSVVRQARDPVQWELLAAPRPPPVRSASSLLQQGLGFGARSSPPVEQEVASVKSASSLYRSRILS